ncbi:MAG: NUDIX domain-containing protein [Methanobacteriota archaeon]|nr:MAG: NUDIX domain-containing protein [Euryarchaeota archaeon]
MIIRHFTATTYIMNQSMDRMLFLWHPKLKSWMPPGGHIEENEDHEQAALREIKEELGIATGKFLQPKNLDLTPFDERARPMLHPFIILEEKIEENHIHLDLIFYAVTRENPSSSPEMHELKWFDPRSITNEKKMFKNVRELAILGFALQEFRTVDFNFFESSSSI